MCVLAGCIGDMPVAPILLEMLEKEEGLAGGYYTGLATIHEGKLRYEKVVGDVAKLKKETDAESLPGTIGIAHSRTPSGGDVEWGHPFIDCPGIMAYVAQGSMGFFKDRTDMKEAGDGLIARGHAFRAVSDGPVGSYPVLGNGKSVHISDVMCHAIEDALADWGDALEAMRQAYMKWPAEIVGLTIHQDEPDEIVVACFNQSLFIGRDETSTYMASTGLALPDSVTWRMSMPANAAAGIRRETIKIRPFDPSCEPVVGICSCAEAERAILAAIEKEPGAAFGKVVFGATKPLWPEGRLAANSPLAYEALERLYRAGRIRFETVQVPGMFNEGTAPQVRVYPV